MGNLFPGIGEVAGAVRRVLNRHPGTRRVRRVMVRASLASIVVASLAVAAFPAPAGAKVAGLSGQPGDRALPAAAAPGSGWSVARSPNPLTRTGQLFWVSCPRADSCVAVGTYVKGSGAGVTLAERWNGRRWRIQRVPSPPGAAWSALNGVSCVSPSACEAVGITFSRSGVRRAVAERWNGTRWQIQPAPSPGGAYLVGVSCTSPTACTAVGGSTPGTPGKALAERWDGSRWRVQPTPSPAGSAFLSGVACTSSSACTAVGGSDAGTLAERWNGTTWSTQATPNPPEGGGFLDGVACLSSSACTAVGNSNVASVAEQWNGTSWQIQSTAIPGGAQFSILNTVACASASACTAAGFYFSASGAFHSLVERRHGTRWTIQATPRLPGGVMSLLIGVTCTSATGCLAVGYSSPNVFGNQSPATLAERWDGSAWRVQHTPDPVGVAAGSLQGVSCLTRSSCTAVGYSSTSRGTTLLPMAQRWNGRTWRIQATPSPADGGILGGVSCPSRSSCMAVGGHGDPNTGVAQGTLAVRWNGRRWQILPTPNPRGGRWALGAVSCTSPSACTAVGGRLVPPGKPTGTLAERWNGRRWRIQATPRLPGKGIKLLTGVACPSRSSCLAVGGEFDPVTGNNLGTLAERWNGRRWRIVPTFKPAPHGRGAFLNGVACASASACTAVGNQTPARTLAERWNGRRWHVQATPNPSGGQNIFLAGVACPARSACTAFGLNLTGSGPLTLAERWSGGRWRIQPTPGLVAFDIGFPAVACPTASACYAVASYTNNGPSLTLVERWNRTGTSTRVGTGRSVAPGALPPACIRARMPGSLPISARIPAAAWSRFRVGSVPSRAASPSPASRIWCGAG
jgi:hypothetical protein